ncbi:DUF2824 family protein [Tatumella sp. OPLPL6]|uniref:DUF2824 family protein n=1 Tax=Tatumella sp. OPLPL6 TaxID=1928657 RepID=UPI000C19A56D|nr:DUF2824 family protein [Tatumella sp. OPLPL6]PIJ46079.1 hypothetical protein BOM24_01575 [Tatumella sp. OPLPL6]
MKLKIIDDPIQLAEFLNDRAITGNIVDEGDYYLIKPDALYLGIYDGEFLAGVHEVRTFWHSTVECHPIYAPKYRGKYAIKAHALFINWLLANSTFTNMVTMVPDTTRYGAIAALAVGAERIGHMKDAYLCEGEPVGITLYQMTRKMCEEKYNVL